MQGIVDIRHSYGHGWLRRESKLCVGDAMGGGVQTDTRTTEGPSREWERHGQLRYNRRQGPEHNKYNSCELPGEEWSNSDLEHRLRRQLAAISRRVQVLEEERALDRAAAAEVLAGAQLRRHQRNSSLTEMGRSLLTWHPDRGEMDLETHSLADLGGVTGDDGLGRPVCHLNHGNRVSGLSWGLPSHSWCRETSKHKGSASASSRAEDILDQCAFA